MSSKSGKFDEILVIQLLFYGVESRTDFQLVHRVQ